MVAILDYDAGNLASVTRAMQSLGADCIITRDEREILQADRLVLPGVGAFGDAMGKLRHYELVDTIHRFVESGKPFFGICLGMQLLFESSEETVGVDGLGLLPGRILRIPDLAGYKVPHMGWNSISINQTSRLFQGIPSDSYVYFVHSYYLQADREADVAAITEYGIPIHAAVERDNLFACQFHPEKSGEVGLRILQNFLSL